MTINAEAAYAEMRPLIHATAREFARRYNRYEDECESRANVIFLEALQKFDPTRGRLEPRIKSLIWCRLLDDVRKWARGCNGLELTDGMTRHYEAGRRPARTDAPSVEELLAALSPDARVVAEMVLFNPVPEYGVTVRKDPGRVRAAIRRDLAGRGWPRSRIEEAFDELSGVGADVSS